MITFSRRICFASEYSYINQLWYTVKGQLGEKHIIGTGALTTWPSETTHNIILTGSVVTVGGVGSGAGSSLADCSAPIIAVNNMSLVDSSEGTIATKRIKGKDHTHYCNCSINRIVGVELKLVVDFSTTKVKSLKYIHTYLELHQTLSNFNLSIFKKVISIYTANYDDH